MTSPLPRIAVIGTGGTISSLGANSLDVLDYPDFGQKLTSEGLIEKFPETRLVADPVPVTFRQVGSTAIGPADWLELREVIHRIAREDSAIAGFVIPHGTATLEETASFLNLTLGVGQPVVLVGAQRPASALGTDAGMNLVNALRVAGCEEARGKGVLVVMNDDPSSRPDLSGADLPLASITARSAMSTATGRISTAHRRRRTCRTRRAGREIGALPRVDVIYSYAGADGDLVEAAVTAGAQGLVSAGFAPGTPESGAAGGVSASGTIGDRRRAVQPRDRPHRAAPPPARDRHRRRRGFDPAKGAHILLPRWILTTTRDIAEIQTAFQSY